jgi:type II secretory pathway component PulL
VIAGRWRGINHAGMTTPAEQLQTEVTKAQTVSNDGVSVTRRSLSELIEYEKHLANKAAVASPAMAFRSMTCRVVPPGAT